MFEDFDIREHAVVGLEARNHAGFGAGRENYVLCFDLLVLRHPSTRRYESVLRRPGEFAVAF